MPGQGALLRNSRKPVHRLVRDGLVGPDRDQPGERGGRVSSIECHHPVRKPSYFMQDLL